uniref:Uncharacterized protein n=1 Tax=Ceratitis capitata TaxID=7213 RepID=W8BLJ0_CERCA
MYIYVHTCNYLQGIFLFLRVSSYNRIWPQKPTQFLIVTRNSLIAEMHNNRVQPTVVLRTSKQTETERPHNRQRHSNSGESTKRNEAADFFGAGAGDCDGDGDGDDHDDDDETNEININEDKTKTTYCRHFVNLLVQ